MFTDNKALIYSLIAVLLLLIAGCPRNGDSGITIAQNDATAPTLTLGAGQPGGQDVTVSAGGSNQNMKLRSKAGLLNLLATANDPESGIQALQIWVSRRMTTCYANGNCTGGNLETEQVPTFESSSPQKKPGETTAASSILGQTLDLSKKIPQGSFSGGSTLG